LFQLCKDKTQIEYEKHEIEQKIEHSRTQTRIEHGNNIRLNINNTNTNNNTDPEKFNRRLNNTIEQRTQKNLIED
jgi:hypothetical protein